MRTKECIIFPIYCNKNFKLIVYCIEVIIAITWASPIYIYIYIYRERERERERERLK